jgi:hypothetical protein
VLCPHLATRPVLCPHLATQENRALSPLGQLCPHPASALSPLGHYFFEYEWIRIIPWWACVAMGIWGMGWLINQVVKAQLEIDFLTGIGVVMGSRVYMAVGLHKFRYGDAY